jgi:hypothetical protein
MCTEEVQFGLPASTTLGHLIMCSVVLMGLHRLVTNYTLFGMAAQTIILRKANTTTSYVYVS